MNPKIFGVVAAIGIAGAGVAVSLKSGECRDVIYTLAPSKADNRADWTKASARVCEGEESPVPEGAVVVWEAPATTAKPLLDKGAKASLAPAEVAGGCACGPVVQPKGGPCTVTETDQGGKQVTRPSRPGEHLYPGTYSGGCIPKDCVETSARRTAGESVPPECGGPPATKAEDPKGIEAKP